MRSAARVEKRSPASEEMRRGQKRLQRRRAAAPAAAPSAAWASTPSAPRQRPALKRPAGSSPNRELPGSVVEAAAGPGHEQQLVGRGEAPPDDDGIAGDLDRGGGTGGSPGSSSGGRIRFFRRSGGCLGFKRPGCRCVGRRPDEGGLHRSAAPRPGDPAAEVDGGPGGPQGRLELVGNRLPLVDHSGNLDAGLTQLGGQTPAIVSGRLDDGPPPRKHSVQMQQPPRGPGEQDAGQVVAAEQPRGFHRAGGDDDGAGADLQQAIPPERRSQLSWYQPTTAVSRWRTAFPARSISASAVCTASPAAAKLPRR